MGSGWLSKTGMYDKRQTSCVDPGPVRVVPGTDATVIIVGNAEDPAM